MMLESLQAALNLEDLGVLALLDILLLAFIIYHVLLFIRGTRSVNIMVALAALVWALPAPRPWMKRRGGWAGSPRDW